MINRIIHISIAFRTKQITTFQLNIHGLFEEEDHGSVINSIYRILIYFHFQDLKFILSSNIPVYHICVEIINCDLFRYMYVYFVSKQYNSKMGVDIQIIAFSIIFKTNLLLR